MIEAPLTSGMITCERKTHNGVQMPSVLDGAFSRRILGAVTSRAVGIRSALGKASSEEAIVDVGLTIDSTGKASIISIASEGQDLMWLVSIDLSGVPIPTPESNCKGMISVRLSVD
jgi:hypothetical protein